MPIRPSSARSTAPSSSTLGVRAWAESIDFSSAAARRLALPRTRATGAGPAAVQRAFALYQTWEARDLGAVRLLQTDVAGKAVWAIHATTDADEDLLEVFSARGTLLASGVIGATGGIAWDATPGAVRDRIAPTGSPSSVAEFHGDVRAAERPTSPSGDHIDTAELRGAARRLLDTTLTTASIDGEESAALRRVLADHHPLTPAARAFAMRLGDLYDAPGPKALRRVAHQPVAALLGASSSASGFAARAVFSSAEVKGRKDAPRVAAFTALTRAGHGWLPTQVAPATKTAAIAALRAAGASAGEARTLVERLTKSGAQLSIGNVYQHDAASSTSVPVLRGLGVFSSTADGKKIAAVVVPADTPPAPPVDARAAVRQLTGVDRPIDVVTPTGAARYDLQWRPAWGGALTATLDLSNPRAPSVVSAQAPAVLEGALRATLTQHLEGALGRRVDVLGWVGRDNAQGPGFVVAHRAPGSLWPVTLSTVRIQLGGAATVTPTAIGASASDAQLAKELALVLARAHAQRLVADPPIGDDARLEVALRTGWRQLADLEAQDATSSPVGFDPTTERAQWMLPRVWSDTAVIVTFAKDGTLRVEEAN